MRLERWAWAIDKERALEVVVKVLVSAHEKGVEMALALAHEKGAGTVLVLAREKGLEIVREMATAVYWLQLEQGWSWAEGALHLAQ